MTRGANKYYSVTDLTRDEYTKVKNTKSKINYLIPLWTLKKNLDDGKCPIQNHSHRWPPGDNVMITKKGK